MPSYRCMVAKGWILQPQGVLMPRRRCCRDGLGNGKARSRGEHIGKRTTVEQPIALKTSSIRREDILL